MRLFNLKLVIVSSVIFQLWTTFNIKPFNRCGFQALILEMILLKYWGPFYHQVWEHSFDHFCSHYHVTGSTSMISYALNFVEWLTEQNFMHGAISLRDYVAWSEFVIHLAPKIGI